MVLLGILARVWRLLNEAMFGKMEVADDSDDASDDEQQDDGGKKGVGYGLAVVGNTADASDGSKYGTRATSSRGKAFEGIEDDDLGEPVQRSDVVQQSVSTSDSDTRNVSKDGTLPTLSPGKPEHVESELEFVVMGGPQSTSTKQQGELEEISVQRKKKKQENQMMDSKHPTKRRKKKANAIDDLFGDL